jgi:hypothetical protein
MMAQSSSAASLPSARELDQLRYASGRRHAPNAVLPVRMRKADLGGRSVLNRFLKSDVIQLFQKRKIFDLDSLRASQTIFARRSGATNFR